MRTEGLSPVQDTLNFSARKPMAMVIDSSDTIRQRLHDSLPKNGVNVRSYSSLEDAKNDAHNFRPDIIIADTLTVADAVILQTFGKPFILIGDLHDANGDDSQTKEALDKGADFYISRETTPEAVAAHIRASLRTREAKSDKDLIDLGAITYDTKGRLTKGKREIVLTYRKRILANFLFRNRGKILTNEEIIVNCLDEGYEIENNGNSYMKVLISRLRAALERLGETDAIRTVFDVGYFVPLPETISAADYVSRSDTINYPETRPTERDKDERIKVLVVDRDYSSLNYLTFGLPSNQFKVTTAPDTEDAERILASQKQDFLLLAEGFVLRPNSKGNTAKWITMLHNEHHAAAALDAGSFTVVRKYPDTRSLAILMLKHQEEDLQEKTQPTIYCPDGIEVNLERRMVLRDGKEITLSGTEWRVLSYLAQNADIPLSYRILITDGLEHEYAWREINDVRTWILRIRKKLGSQNLITTVKGVGYKLNSTGVGG